VSDKPSEHSLPLAIRFVIAAAIALMHFYISFMLVNYAYALGDASRPVPLPLKIALLAAGAPLVWPAYFVRFIAGRWNELSFYLLLALTPINSAFCGWLLMRLFTLRSRHAPRPV
jgi:hypothetical protein